MSVVLSLVVSHVRYFWVLSQFLILLRLRLLIALMQSILVLVRVTATSRGLLTLLAVVGRVHVCTTSCIVMHADTGATRTQRKCILFIGA
jgi:hypothetical protein